jgi:hypothetical protein
VIQKWKIPTIESLVFEVLSTFQNYKFCEDCTKIPCFIDSEHSKVDRRHLYEWYGEKILCRTELRWRRNGRSKLAIQCNSTQNHVQFIYFWTEKLTSVWDCSHPCCVLHTLYELTSLTHFPPFCNMGKEKKLEVELLDAAQAWRENLLMWLKKSKWDIVSVKKMIWHVPYTIGPYIIS